MDSPEQDEELLPVSSAAISFLLDGPRFGIVPSPWTSAEVRRDGSFGVVLTHVTSGGSIYHYLPDHLGSTRQVRDSTRNLVFAADYEPFGKAYNVYNSEAFQYAGEKHDDATSLVHLRARQYDPDIGRFISLDPVLGELSWPQTLNRYPYVANNPLRYTDPTGEVIPLIVIAAIVILAAAGAGTAVVANTVPEARPYTDAAAMVVGFVPVYGDAFAGGYFLTQDAMDCAAGQCNAMNIGLDLFGLVPMVGDMGKLAKGARFADLLPFTGRLFGTAGDVTRAAGKADDVAGLPYALRGGQADTFVYVGVRGGTDSHASITSNLLRRQSEWGDTYRLRQITPEPVTRGQARAIEEALIVRNPHFDNAIHSISPRHTWYRGALNWDEAWLTARGL
jgi:RHS repeat-associated protein